MTPPNYNTFLPPLSGGTYVDPVFGTTIKRVTNAILTPNIDSGGISNGSRTSTRP